MDAIGEEYRYSLQLMHDQNKFAESKNTSLIVFTSAFAFGVLSNIENIRYLFVTNIISIFPSYKEQVFSIGLIVFISLLLLSSILSLLSFMPQVKQITLENHKTKNLFFFDSNISFSNSIELYNYFNKRYRVNTRIKLDMCNQILNLAKITNRKYSYFKIATIILFFNPILTIIICIVSYLIL